MVVEVSIEERILERYEDLFTAMKGAPQDKKVKFLNSLRDAVIKLTGNKRPSDYDLIVFVLDCPLTCRGFLE